MLMFIRKISLNRIFVFILSLYLTSLFADAYYIINQLNPDQDGHNDSCSTEQSENACGCNCPPNSGEDCCACCSTGEPPSMESSTPKPIRYSACVFDKTSCHPHHDIKNEHYTFDGLVLNPSENEPFIYDIKYLSNTNSPFIFFPETKTRPPNRLF